MKILDLFWFGSLLATTGVAGAAPAGNPSSLDEAARPISFEANIGQAPAAAQFLAHGQNGNLLLTREEAWLTLRSGGADNEAARAVRLQLAGANPRSRIEGLDPLPGKANYFVGHDPSQWRIGAPTFAKVKYHDVYPGVDLIYYGNQQKLEYDLVVRPGAEPGQIKLQFGGAESITLDPSGDLLLKLGNESIRQHKPVVYQEIGGARRMIEGHYVIHSAMQVGFQVADYDETRPLVIDPVLSYAATFGGGGANHALAVALDGQGNVYVTGNTTANNFLLVHPIQTNFLGNQDVFVTKFDTNGNIVYSTYLGGGPVFNLNNASSGQGIAVDVAGNAYVTGYTQVTNFPVSNPLQSTNGGGFDAFVTEINSNGNALVFSTYLGGKGFDAASGIALNTNGDVIVTGYTQSTNFPTASAMQPVYGGNGDAFVAKLARGGGSMVYSTFLGGSDSDNNGPSYSITLTSSVLANLGGAVAVDIAGNAYLTGWTFSTNFPILNAYQTTNAAYSAGSANAVFVTKFDPSGNIVYSTYFGGQYGDYGRGIGVDFDGNVYFAGASMAGDLPTTNAFQPFYAGNYSAIGDGFVAALDATGTNLLYCTYLGGSGDDQINGLAVRLGDGAVAVTGTTDSPDFPLLNSVQSAGYQGLFKSSNGGASWSADNNGLGSGVPYAVACDPANPSILYAVTRSFNKSTNGGASWFSASSGLYGISSPLESAPLGNLLAADTAHPGTLYLGVYGGVFKTTSGGAGWTAMNAGLPASTWVQTVGLDPQNPNMLYAGTYAHGLYKSTDGANNWNAITNTLNTLNVISVLVDPQNSANVYAGVDNLFSTSLYKSTNGGVTWSTSGNGLAAGPLLALAPAPGGRIYAVIGSYLEASTLCLSTNGGTNWTQIFQAIGLKFTQLAVAPPQAPALTIATAGNNDVVSWPAAFSGYALQATASLNPTNWQTVALAPATNNGNLVVSVPMAGSQGYYRLVLTNNAPTTPTLYLGTDAASGQGVLRSTDGGINFSPIGFPGSTISALAVNPTNSAAIYAGVNGGNDIFVATLTPAGQLNYASYLGGSGADQGTAIAFKNPVTVVTVGSTFSGDFPTNAAAGVPQLKAKPGGAAPLSDGGNIVAQSCVSTTTSCVDCPGNKTLPPITLHAHQSIGAQNLYVFAPDKDPTYSFSGLPSGVATSEGAVLPLVQQVEIEGTPDTPGNYPVDITVHDGECTYHVFVTIIVL